MENVIEHLKENLSSLTNSQRTVANFILENPTEVAFLTVDQLARRVGTSSATIMRLAFNLGYTGYSEFQKELQKNIRGKAAPKTRFEANLLDQGNSNLWTSVINHHIHNIQHILELIPSETLEKVISLLVNSSRIYCTNVRSGMPVSQHLTHGLNRLLGNCHLLPADRIEWVDEVINFGPNDIVIAVSYPRYSTRLINLLEKAKEKGTKIISITDSYSSPLVKYSDIILPCTSSSLSFHNSIVSSIVVADYIISAVAINYPKKTKERLDQLNDILTKLDYHYL
jgi:DNA-binding MurR/RpiR family transcriptional regulator